MVSDRLGILDRLLAFMDRPWKAVTVLVFVVVLGIGYALWEKRAEIASAVLTREVRPRLLRDKFRPVALQLLKDTNADAVMLIEGNLNSNTARDIEGYDRDQQPWIALTGIRPIFGSESSVDIVIRFLRNEAVCYEVRDGGPEMLAEERLGIQRACLTAIPPIPDLLVGAIWLGWRKNPLEGDEEVRAQVLLHRAAGQLATW